ncbi:hypothetical protein ACHAPT_011026 [Fusarium lateritium]
MEDSTRVYEKGRHLFVYQRALNLTAWIRKCGESSRTKYLHVYTDSLSLDEPNVPDYLDLDVYDTQLRVIHIFARSFLAGGPNCGWLNVRCQNLRLFLYNEEALPSLQLDYRHRINGRWELLRAGATCPHGEDCTNNHSQLREEDAGREILFSGLETRVRPLRNVSQLELTGPSYEDTKVFSDIDQVGFLRRFLEDLFVTVSTDVVSNSSDSDTVDLVSMSRLRFIIRCLRMDPASAQFTVDAKKLLDRLDLPRRFPRPANCPGRPLYVPVLQPDYTKEQLKWRINNAIDAEKKIAEIIRDHKQQLDLEEKTQNTIKAIATTMASLEDPDTSKKTAITALEDVERKRKDLREAATVAEEKGKDLQKAMEEYAKDQARKTLWSILAAAANIVVAIGVSIATCGVAAPVTMATAAKAVKEAVVLSTGQKVWNAIKKLAGQVSGIAAKIEAAHKSQKTYTAAAASMDLSGHKTSALKGLTQVVSQVTATTLPVDTMEPVDFLGLMADWDEVDVNIGQIFTDIRTGLNQGTVIPALGGFETSMRNQAIRGRTLLKAMMVAQTATQLYCRQLAEEKARTAVNDRITALGINKHEDTDGLALRYFQRALIDIKRSVFVLFHECILSLIYFQNGAGFPTDHNEEEVFKGLTANLSIGNGSKGLTFDHFYDVLQAQLGAAVAADIEQTIPGGIIVDTSKDAGTVFDRDWKSCLVDNNEMAFHVPTTLQDAEGWRRVRIRSLWATFDGLDDQENARYYFILGPRNIDISSGWDPVQFYIPPFALEKKGMEGDHLDRKDLLVRPALFGDGTLGFDPQHITGLSLASISKITVTFKCEAISRRQS